MSRSPGPIAEATLACRLTGGLADPAVLGGKGAALDRLVGWAIPVPDTAVVTTRCYELVAADPDLARLLDEIRGGATIEEQTIEAAFQRAPVAPAIADRLVAVATDIGGGRPVALRSSATVEDLGGTSFAGQYRSVLGVDPTDPGALLGALRSVWASLWFAAPCAYRRAFGVDESAIAMAVVVMAMVPAERAGVAFTVDPLDPDRLRVEEVRGLGESLVSGERTPQVWLLPRDAESGRELPASVDEAARLALRIEELAGAPQDVEWAWDGDRVWIVQARPITVAPDEGDGFDDPPSVLADLDLTTAGIGEMLPGVLPPLRWELNRYLVEEAFRQLLDDLGVLPGHLVGPGGLLRRVSGRVAIDFGSVQEMAGALPGSAADELETQYFGHRPTAATPGSARPHRRWRRLTHDLRVTRLRRRAIDEAGLAIVAARAVLADLPDLDELRWGELLALHDRLVDLAARAMAAELGVAADAAASYSRLESALGRRLEPADASRLARRATAHGLVPPAADPRASMSVFAGPTWQESGRTPPIVHERTTPDSDAIGEALAGSPQRPANAWARLRARAISRLGSATADQLQRREEAKAAVLSIGGAVRRVHLALGARLVAAEALSRAAEVELLSLAELRRCASGEHPPIAVLDRRRRWHELHESEGPLPVRFRGRPRRPPLTVPDGDRHEGWPASGGRVTATAQVVDHADGSLEAGAVLVARATDASWSPLFLRAGAVVLERGGPLSHAAILARELGIPAVLNVPNATALLAGQRVIVDGDAGVVAVLREASETDG